MKKLFLVLLAVSFGWAGIHRLVLGYRKTALIYLVYFIIAILLSDLFSFFLILGYLFIAIDIITLLYLDKLINIDKYNINYFLYKISKYLQVARNFVHKFVTITMHRKRKPHYSENMSIREYILETPWDPQNDGFNFISEDIANELWDDDEYKLILNYYVACNYLIQKGYPDIHEDHARDWIKMPEFIHNRYNSVIARKYLDLTDEEYEEVSITGENIVEGAKHLNSKDIPTVIMHFLASIRGDEISQSEIHMPSTFSKEDIIFEAIKSFDFLKAKQ